MNPLITLLLAEHLHAENSAIVARDHLADGDVLAALDAHPSHHRHHRSRPARWSDARRWHPPADTEPVDESMTRAGDRTADAELTIWLMRASGRGRHRGGVHTTGEIRS